MGILMVRYDISSLQPYLPLITGDKIPPEMAGRSFFKQLERVDVSEYDTRQVRHEGQSPSHRNVRVENGVLHSKSDATILYEGNEIPLHGSKTLGSQYVEWHAYPNITVGLILNKMYNPWWVYSGGWISGTYVQPSVFFIVRRKDWQIPEHSRIAFGVVTPNLKSLPGGAQGDYAEWEGYGSYYGGDFISVTNEDHIKFMSHLGTMSYHAKLGYWDTNLTPDDISSIDSHWLLYAQEIYASKANRQLEDSTSGLTIKTADPEFSWLLCENGFPDGYGKINYVLSEHYRTLMEQHAYLDALSSVQHAWDNGVMNVLEFVKFFVNLFVHHKVEVPKNWKDGWLSYRYVYGTTKLDQEDLAKDVLNGLNQVLKDGQRYVKVRGNYSMDVAGSHIKCTCEVYLKNRVYDFLDNCRLALERFGLIPDLYMVWDMTPYSFIFDWFLPIGNTLNTLDAEKNFDGDNCIYNIGPVSFSFKYNRDIEGANVSLYSRRIQTKPVIQAYYWFVEPSNTSVKTWGKRILDGLALFT